MQGAGNSSGRQRAEFVGRPANRHVERGNWPLSENRSNYWESAAVASRSAIRRARWNSAISSCSRAVWIFRWPQPSVTVGMPWAVSQLASRPPLVTANSGGEVFCLDRRRCRGDARFVAAQAKRFVVEPSFESYAAAFSVDTSHRGGRSLERGFDFLHDSLAEFWIVAAGFGANSHVVGHDVGRVAALMTPTLLVPSPSSFVDESVPAVLAPSRRWRATRWRLRSRLLPAGYRRGSRCRRYRSSCDSRRLHRS